MDGEQGSVKWFSDAKGNGFIQRASGDAVFVHLSAIRAEGSKSLNEGDTVEFTVTKGPKGLQAENVARLEECRTRRLRHCYKRRGREHLIGKERRCRSNILAFKRSRVAGITYTT